MVLYQITLDAVTRKNVYPLHTTGRMYPHVVDNLILLHDRDSKVRFFSLLVFSFY